MQQIIGVMTHPILLPFQHVYAPDTSLFLANIFVCLYFLHFGITGKINNFERIMQDTVYGGVLYNY
jgi:hypothetical protein